MDTISFLLKEYDLFYLEKLVNNCNSFDNYSWFIFDLRTNKCQYICPAISSITGLYPNDYLNKGIEFFLEYVIYPEDYTEFVKYILSKNMYAHAKGTDTSKFLLFRIKHKLGYWVRVNGHIIKASKKSDSIADKIIGYIYKESPVFEELYEVLNSITNREREILQLISNGFSSKIIAERLNICETTVISHRKNLIQKLQVKNTAELIKKAAIQKLIG